MSEEGKVELGLGQAPGHVPESCEHSSQSKRSNRMALMKKMKLSTKGVVNTTQEENANSSPGFDNESKAKYWLSEKGFEIESNLGNGAYATVFRVKNPEGESMVTKITMSDERLENA